MEPIIANRYRLDERIGRGAVGEVWRARDTTLNRDVAVKIVNLSAHPDPSAAARFRREARATAGLSHPNVVRVFDAGFDDPGEAFMVMELLGGPSLGELAGKISVLEAVELTAQVAAGLGAAHDVGVIHRDVKPTNVMLDGVGDRRAAKVVDFGIARLAQSGDATLTAPATALGTAAYMSPEQASGTAVTPATDVYSLGCLLFALLTGKPPYVGEGPLAVLQQHVFSTPPLPSERRPDIPEAVDALVARMMLRDPEQRPDVPSLTAMTRAVIAQLGGVGSSGSGGTSSMTRISDAVPTMPMAATADNPPTRMMPAQPARQPTAAYPRSPQTPNAPQDGPQDWSRTVIQSGGPPPPNRQTRRRRPVGLIVAIVIMVALLVGGLILLDGVRSGSPAQSASPTTSASPTKKAKKEQTTKASRVPVPLPRLPTRRPPTTTAPKPPAPKTSAPAPKTSAPAPKTSAPAPKTSAPAPPSDPTSAPLSIPVEPEPQPIPVDPVPQPIPVDPVPQPTP